MPTRLIIGCRVRRHYAALLASGIVFALAVPAAGQPPPGARESQELADLSLEQLLNVEVQSVFGASKYLQRVTEAPASVTIITAEEIARYGYRTLGDALRMVRGFYTSNDRQYSFVGVRGFQWLGDYNTHLLILLDGHRANDNVYDQASIDDTVVSLDEIERIEVIRGPSSSLYGSNAFFGVVNIVTKRSPQTSNGEVALEGGTFGRRAIRAAWGGPIGRTGGFTLSAAAARSDGPQDLYYPELDDPATNFGIAHELDFMDRRNLRATLDIGAFTVQGGWNRRRKGIPTGAYGAVFNDPRGLLVDTWGYVDAAWSRQWSPKFGLNVRGFYDDYRYLGVYPLDYGEEGGPQVIIENRDESYGRWAGTEVRGSGSWGRHRWTAGAEYRHNFDQTQRNFDVDPSLVYLDDRRRSNTLGIYAQDDIQISRLFSASLGIRRDMYEGFSDPLMPRLALIVTPARSRTFKLLYGEAYRAPNVYEMYYAYPPYKSNPWLKPEEIRTVEFAWEEYVGRHLRLGANAFRNSVSNLVAQVTDPADGMLVFENVDEATAVGVEVEGEARWSGGVQARASYVWQRAWDDELDVHVPNSPAHVGQAAVTVPLGSPRALASVTLRAISSRAAKDGSRVAGYAIPAVTLLAPSIWRRFSVQVSLDNVFDHVYSDPAAEELPQLVVPQDGRTLSVKVTWRLR